MFRQMEKLIELLNEFEKETKKSEYSEWRDLLGGRPQYLRCDTVESELLIISKGYHFIKWLVENEKIEEGNFFYNTGDLPDDDVSKLLMLLAIKDEPIEFLVSILK